MMSIPLQSSTKSILAFHPFTSQKPNFTPFKTSFSRKPVASSLQLSTHIGLKTRPVRRIQRINVAADSELDQADINDTADSELAAEEAPLELTDTEILDSEEREVQYVPIHKHRLVLKFIWMEKNIGLCLDQMIPGYGPVPLSPYYFWPRKDAWEELKTTIESKPWISQKKMIILLNQATDIINLWQQSGGNLS